jgi:aminoglycoside phosphotransferase family enzyme/predicted kinase
MCRKEVSLNQRLAPHVYLGVRRLTRAPSRGRLEIDGRGPVVDYLVQMRRLPDEQSLASRMRAGTAGGEEMAAIGEAIGRFHRGAAPASRAFGPPTFLRNSRENVAALEPYRGRLFPAAVFDELRAYWEAVRTRFGRVLERRVGDGRTRDGHGDLRAEHVYLEDGGVTVIDCVEFDPRYRRSDTALDFGFLAMDVVSSGWPDLAEPLIAGYERAAGDRVAEVLPLYCWYRALVRAKLACILAGEAEAPENLRGAAEIDARRYVYHALRFARAETTPVLAIAGGLPGTGKTTTARALATVLGAGSASADETRKRLAGLAAGTRAAAETDQGIYAPDMNERVYCSLAESASAALDRGRSFVVDATFRRRADREAMCAVAAKHGARFVMVECTAPEEVVLERLRKRSMAPDDWSDATVETFHALREQFETVDEMPAAEHVRVDSSRPPAKQVDAVLEVLRET